MGSRRKSLPCLSAEGGTRTHTPLRTPDFESGASAIPPLRPRADRFSLTRPRPPSTPRPKTTCGPRVLLTGHFGRRRIHTSLLVLTWIGAGRLASTSPAVSALRAPPALLAKAVSAGGIPPPGFTRCRPPYSRHCCLERRLNDGSLPAVCPRVSAG